MTNELEKRISNALDIASRYGQIDEAHHKTWTIDQMVRCLTEKEYTKWVEANTAPDEDGEIPSDWDTGTAP